MCVCRVCMCACRCVCVCVCGYVKLPGNTQTFWGSFTHRASKLSKFRNFHGFSFILVFHLLFGSVELSSFARVPFFFCRLHSLFSAVLSLGLAWLRSSLRGLQRATLGPPCFQLHRLASFLPILSASRPDDTFSIHDNYPWCCTTGPSSLIRLLLIATSSDHLTFGSVGSSSKTYALSALKTMTKCFEHHSSSLLCSLPALGKHALALVRERCVGRR